MKRLSYFVVFILLGITVQAQSPEFTKNLKATVYTSFFLDAKAKLNILLQENSTQIISQNENATYVNVKFNTTEQGFQKLQSDISILGFVSAKDISTSNLGDELKERKLRLEYLEKRMNEYKNELKIMSEKDDKYYSFWDEIRSLENQIYEENLRIASYGVSNLYHVEIEIFDETVDLTSSEISWVNMPGVSADLMITENPLNGTSAEQYMGYHIKYLFTRGKSFATIGAFKKFSTEATDSSTFNEMFNLGFGQDFYSRYFGRGKNKFLNLYTGYTVGGIFATSDYRKASFFYLEPHFGLELFKNKYILIDNKVGYFVPTRYNRNLRGIHYNISFNFVF